ncbi:MAG: YCF48-related protein [Acidobacteriota bacterium]
MNIASVWMLIPLFAWADTAQKPPGSGRSTAQNPPATARPAGSQSTTKAIWERVFFNKDIGLKDIACTGPETCWVVGEKSTILHTSDGGKTWQVQLGGDPEATDPPLIKVFFLDSKHGWARTSSGKILGTTDGSTWVELSNVSGTTNGVWFLSPRVGLELENPDSTSQSTLRRSEDGGKSWKAVSRCSVETTIDGLPRKLDCMMETAQFLSPTVGFAGGAGTTGMAKYVAVFGKTTDGGQTWAMSVIPESKRQISSLHFWSEKEGIAVLEKGEEVHRTADGGATWTRSVKQRLWPSFYGSGEGKLIVGAAERGDQIAYSVNGGRNFTTRPFGAPAWIRAVTFVNAQNGYLVGDHAMVYRYRIVPSTYRSPGMIAAVAP